MSEATANEMRVSFAGGKRVDCRYGDFTIRTDQSPANGGEGTEPEPFDLFLASLAACAGVYVLGFCQNREIPTDGIEVVQRWTRDAEKRLTDVAIEIRVPPSFPEKYHAALVRSAEKCSVKRAMQDPPAFDVRTVVSG